LSRIADEDKVRVFEAVERVFREGGAAIEANVVDLTGRHVPFDFAACRLQIGDQIYLVGTAYDITVRRQAEERLRQGEKMRVLGQMASGIAHDFNNLLGGVIGFAEVLKASVGEDPQLVECADKILTSANRAAAITMKLRTFSRQSPFVLAPVDLHQVVEEAVELLRHTIGAHIPIVRHLDAAEAVVQGDAAEIQSAIMNLGMNARDAMPRGGTVTVATKVLELQAPLRLAQDFELPVGRYIELSVADTGTGMDAAVQSRLFEPFFTTKGVGKGTGLGLANVFGCMKQHQGAIGVHSEPGRGTTFRLVFPLVRQG
jgi:signal transduction histidine kinase